MSSSLQVGAPPGDGWVQPSGDNDADERRWRRWQEKGRAHDLLVRRRLRWIAATAALGLAMWWVYAPLG